MARRKALGVWLYGRRVAEIASTRPGEVVCRYSGDALDAWPGGLPLLSCSLPLGPRPHRDAGIWFRGLLPEGNALQAMAEAARVPTYDTFGMLERFGRDVAGAVVIAEDDPGVRPGDVEPYTPAQLEEEVAGLEEHPLALHDDSELSLAGLQNKLLLIETDDGWARPVGGRPSTHILKVEDRRFPGLIAMEAACLRLARAVGLTDIDIAVTNLAGIDCLIVSRFDRRVVDGVVTRVHQEDACQALGRDPDAANRRGKYEAAGGPALHDVATLLDRYAAQPLLELTRLVAAMTFTVTIGNADAHGKNVALLHTDPGQISLAPLYDTVPTALWPTLPDRAAMTIGGRAQLSEVTVAALVEEARAWRLDAAVAATAVTQTVEALREAVREVDVPEPLSALVSARCDELLS